MALSRLGDFIEIIDKRNTDQEIRNVLGLNNKKEFMPTVATINEFTDLSKYKIVKKGMFVFSGMQTGRDNCIRIGFSDFEDSFVISPAYTTFIVNNILPEYFFMIFKSSEMDRYGAFLSDSSVRSNLDWDVFCDIEIDIPSMDKQQKVVDVYLSLVANQKAYENGLEDLKLTCDAYIEDLRRKYPLQKIGEFIEHQNEKNSSLEKYRVIGVGTKGIDIPKVEASKNTSNYNIVNYNSFIYNPSRINIGSIGLYKGDETVLCSPIYNVFKCKEQMVIPEYLMMWFKREEFKRYTTFHSIASVRNNFTLNLMSEVEIPIPSIEIQNSIVNIYNALTKRRKIIRELKIHINKICPILIKGSIK